MMMRTESFVISRFLLISVKQVLSSVYLVSQGLSFTQLQAMEGVHPDTVKKIMMVCLSVLWDTCIAL